MKCHKTIAISVVFQLLFDTVDKTWAAAKILNLKGGRRGETFEFISYFVVVALNRHAK